MGNVFQCCHFLSNYFKCRDAPLPTGAETSPLLSSDNSECDSLTLADDTEDDLSTVPTGATNPALEPEHFLFPDLILSSNLGGDVAIVEPMVCLLVSEEEEGLGGDGRMDEAGDRADTWRSRVYSEVETQTEEEMQIAMGVQTQTETQAEVQTQTERVVFCLEREIREINTGIWKNVDSLEEHKKMKLAKKDLERQSMAHYTKAIDLFEEFQDFPVVKDMDTKLDKGNRNFLDPQLDLVADKAIVLKLKLDYFAARPSEGVAEHNDLQIQENVMEEDSTLMESAGHISEEQGLIAEQNNSELNSEKEGCPSKYSSDHSVILDQKFNLSSVETHKTMSSLHKNDWCESDDSHKPAKMGGNESSVPCVVDLDTSLLQDEDETGFETKQMTLFLVDKLFLEAPHIKGKYV